MAQKMNRIGQLTQGLHDPLNLRKTAMVWSRLFVLLAGGTSIALGMMSLIEWHVGIALSLPLQSSFVLMRYATAVMFLLCGGGFIFMMMGWRVLVMACMGLASIASFLTLFGYISNVNIGITIFPSHAYTAADITHYGRLTFPGSLCFFCTGISCIFRSSRNIFDRRPLIIGFLGAIVTSVGFVSFLGSLSGINFPLEWGITRSMSPHVTIGLLILGLGTLALAWGDGSNREVDFRSWLSLTMAVAITTGAVFLWKILIAQQRQTLQQEILAQGQAIKNEIEANVQFCAQFFNRAGKYEDPDSLQKLRAFETELFRANIKGCKVISWIDPSLHTCWSIPLSGKGAMQDLRLGFEERQQAAIELARDKNTPIMMSPIDLVRGGKGLSILTPIFRNGDFSGCISEGFNSQEFFDAILKNIAPGYSVALLDGNNEFYRRPNTDGLYRKEWKQEIETDFHGAHWKIQVWPTEILFKRLQTYMPEWALAVGLMMAAIFALLIQRLQLKHRFL